MADENVTAAQNAQTTQPETNDGLIKSDVYHNYWMSDNKFACEPITARFTFEGPTYYPFIKAAPSPDLKSPKFDWAVKNWIENDGSAIGEQVAKVDSRVDKLATSVDNLAQAHDEAVKTDESTQKQLGNLAKMIAIMNANSGEQTKAIKQLADTINQKQAPAQPTDATQTTTAQPTEAAQTTTAKDGE